VAFFIGDLSYDPSAQPSESVFLALELLNVLL